MKTTRLQDLHLQALGDFLHSKILKGRKSGVVSQDDHDKVVNIHNMLRLLSFDGLPSKVSVEIQCDVNGTMGDVPSS